MFRVQLVLANWWMSGTVLVVLLVNAFAWVLNRMWVVEELEVRMDLETQHRLMWCNSLYRYGAGCGRCSCFLIVLAQPASQPVRSKKRSGSGSGCGIERWSRKLIKLKGIWYRSGTRRPRRSGDSQDRRTNDRHGSDSGMEKWRVLPLTVSSGVTRWLAGRLRRILWDDGDLTIDGLNKLAISNTFQFLYFHHRELGSSILSCSRSVVGRSSASFGPDVPDNPWELLFVVVLLLLVRWHGKA